MISELTHGPTIGNDVHMNITLKKGDELVVIDNQVQTKDDWI